jgi:transposase
MPEHSPVEPDWANIQRELKRKHVTLSLLWDEYIERNPDRVAGRALVPIAEVHAIVAGAHLA